jgi:hypothetical protein
MSVSKVVVVNTINVSMQGGESLSRSGSLGYGKTATKAKAIGSSQTVSKSARRKTHLM